MAIDLIGRRTVPGGFRQETLNHDKEADGIAK
jgi:hypothetical protein